MQVIIPDYSVGGRKVDFALCHPPLKPVVSIEVNPTGQIEGIGRQLSESPLRGRVPIIIHTDGPEWYFFHPTAGGDYKEHWTYKVNLIEADNQESARRLNRYLNYELICTGEAITSIRDDCWDLAKQREIETNLPKAWLKLVEEADEFLIDIMAEQTESLCGYQPTGEQVLDFLKSLDRTSPQLRETPAPPIQKRPSRPLSKGPPTRLVVTMPSGEKVAYGAGADTFAKVIEKIGIERVRNLRQTYGISLISTSRHPKYAQRKIGQYYILTQINTQRKKQILETIASNLGVRLEVEIIPKN